MDNPALNDATNTALDVITNDEMSRAHVQLAASGLLAWFSLYSLQDWVAIVTIIYIIFQTGLLIPKYWAMIKPVFSKKSNDDAKK